MNHYIVVVERCSDTGLFVGYIPNLPGAHSQGDTVEELWANMKEVLQLLLGDGLQFQLRSA